MHISSPMCNFVDTKHRTAFMRDLSSFWFTKLININLGESEIQMDMIIHFFIYLLHLIESFIHSFLEW